MNIFIFSPPSDFNLLHQHLIMCRNPRLLLIIIISMSMLTIDKNKNEEPSLFLTKTWLCIPLKIKHEETQLNCPATILTINSTEIEKKFVFMTEVSLWQCTRHTLGRNQRRNKRTTNKGGKIEWSNFSLFVSQTVSLLILRLWLHKRFYPKVNSVQASGKTGILFLIISLLSFHFDACLFLWLPPSPSLFSPFSPLLLLL